MMFHVEHIKNCPVCGEGNHNHFLTTKDYSFSQKEFEIIACESCGFKFTNPRPDENSVGQFYHFEAYVSHSDSNKGLINFIYQKVKKHALKKKLALVSKYFSKQKSLLDYGCGSGDFLGYCKENGLKVFGVEKDDETRNLAKKKHAIDVVPPKDFSRLNTKYDVITLWHVLEHLHNLNEDIEQIINHLSENGRLIVAVPNRQSYDAQFYKERWAAYDVPRHLYHFDKQSVRLLFEKHGFVLEEIRPMIFDSFYVSLLSEKQTNGFLIRAFFVGLLSNLRALGKKPNHSSLIYILKQK